MSSRFRRWENCDIVHGGIAEFVLKGKKEIGFPEEDYLKLRKNEQEKRRKIYGQKI